MMCMVLRRAPCLAGLGAERDMRKLEAHFFAFILICHSLALSLNKTGCTRTYKIKSSFLRFYFDMSLACTIFACKNRKNGRDSII